MVRQVLAVLRAAQNALRFRHINDYMFELLMRHNACLFRAQDQRKTRLDLCTLRALNAHSLCRISYCYPHVS